MVKRFSIEQQGDTAKYDALLVKEVNVSTTSSHFKSSSSLQPESNEFVTLTEEVKLTTKQYEVLNVVCNTYEKSVSEYMQEALVDAMKSDIEEGNFCDALLDKLDGDDNEKDNRMNSSPSASFRDDIDSLQF